MCTRPIGLLSETDTKTETFDCETEIKTLHCKTETSLGLDIELEVIGDI